MGRARTNESSSPKSRCFPTFPPRTLYPTGLLPGAVATWSLCILHGTCERRWPRKVCSLQVGCSPFSSGELFVCCIDWMVWRQPGWSDLGLGLPPILPVSPEEKFCLQKWSPKSFLPVYRPRNCKHFSSDFSRVKSLLHYSFNCSKKTLIVHARRC